MSEATETGAVRPEEPLSEFPSWTYLMREFMALYQHGRSGGSAKIRSHQKAVREGISKVLDCDPPFRARVPTEKPVTAHLKRALDNARQERTGSVVRAIESVMPELSWEYGYEKVPKGLSKKYAYAEFAGPHGPVVSEKVILGIVLFGPKCTYPAHSHVGLTESYVVLSGSVSENDDGVWAPGSVIFNPPGRMHRITVSDTEPALLAYAWQGGYDNLANQKMTFKRVT